MATTDWIIASTGVTDSLDGDTPWSNPTRVVASDESDANSSIGTSGTTEWLRSSHNFAGQIPVDQIIQGIEVRAELGGSNGDAEILEAQLYFRGAWIGTKKTALALEITAGDANVNIGGDSDLWGIALPMTELFCFPLQFGFRCRTDAGLGTDIFCDATWMRLTHALPGNPGITDHHPMFCPFCPGG